MASILHALNITNIVNGIKSCSKKKLLSCLSSMDKSSLIHLIVSALKESQPQNPQIKQIIDTLWMDHPDETAVYCNHIKQFFINQKKKKKVTDIKNANNLFTSLPSSIGAYIISFSNMRDRINNELISKDLYEFCQIPMAKYHLVIDHKFVKALYFNTINIKKYFHVKYLDIKYVFKDGRYEKFEHKYYSLITKIISKSPSLNTIKYELEYLKFKSKLSVNNPGDSWSGYTGHILEWMDLIKNNNNSVHNVFSSVSKLIYIPSQFRLDNDWRINTHNTWRHSNIFYQFLPNLKSFSMPKPRLYPARAGILSEHDNNDFEWKVFRENVFHNKLEVINIDLVPYAVYGKQSASSEHAFYSMHSYCPIGEYSVRHINLNNNPLSHFYKFTQLKVLKLKFPIFMTCSNYYLPIMDSKNINISQKCLNLKEICLEFVNDGVIHFNPTRSQLQLCISDNIIDNICKFILSYSPNIVKYKLITSKEFIDKRFNHLIGFYDRLESLNTNVASIISNKVRMISLKRLTLRLYDNNKGIKSTFYELGFNDLSRFVNLESFKCIYINKWKEKWLNLDKNIEEFIKYISFQKNNKKLQYISLFHETEIRNKNIRKTKKMQRQHFNLKKCTKNVSLELCKSIISLLTIKNNFSLKSMELCPVALKQKELKYLFFWFSNGHGAFDSTNAAIKQGTILTDIYCSQ